MSGVADGVGWAQDGDAVVVARFGSGDRVSLAGSAAVIWRLAAAGTDREAVVRTVQEHYDSDPEQIATAVRTTLDELVAQGLLRGDAATVQR